MTRTPEFRSQRVPEAGGEFSWPDLQRLIDVGAFGTEQAGVRGADFRALQEHRSPATGIVVRANALGIEAGLAAGGMFSVNSVDDLHPWVARRAELLEDQVLIPVNVNCHVSLFGESALGVHADIHDVHALQTAGSKYWGIFGNGPEPGEQTHEFVTSPGDELFLPRGWWHGVRTVEPSIHLTFGVSWPTAATLVPQVEGGSLWQIALEPDLSKDVRRQIEVEVARALNRPVVGLLDDLTEELRIRTPWRPRSDLLAAVEPVVAIRLRRRKWCRVRVDDSAVFVEGSATSVRLPLGATGLVESLVGGQVLDAQRSAELTGGLVTEERFEQVARALLGAGLGQRVFPGHQAGT